MGVTTVDSSVNLSFNMALCVWLSYYEANHVSTPGTFYWDKVGKVWFSIVIVPWYDHDHEFGMGWICSNHYYDYVNEAKKAASDIAKYGQGKIGYLNIVGKGLSYDEAEDRLIKLVFWGDGYKVADKTIKVYGGPTVDSINGTRTIDISADFNGIHIQVD